MQLLGRVCFVLLGTFAGCLWAIPVTAGAQDSVPEEFLEQSSQLAHTWVRYVNSGPEGQRDEQLSDQLQMQLAEFLNVALNDYPQTPATKRALDIYAQSSMEFARQNVALAGDYKKAIDILESAESYYRAIGADAYAPLGKLISDFEEMRYVTVDRFNRLQLGMTPEEVKEIAGVPYYENIQVDERRGVEVWLYRKREGGASAVYFKLGDRKVNDKKYEAIKTKVVD